MHNVHPKAVLLPQELQVGFARKEDEEQLSMILAEYGMGIPGRIEEQLVVKAGGQVLAGAKVAQTGADRFFLEVLGVRKEYLAQGIGRLLLGEILKNPWRCCRHSAQDGQAGGRFELATLARGGAGAFYEKMGFAACRMEELPDPYREQCDACPEKKACQPVPMIYAGGNGA